MTYYSEYIHQKNQKDKRNITLSKQKETQVDKYIRYRNAGTTTCILSTFSMKCGSSRGNEVRVFTRQTLLPHLPYFGSKPNGLNVVTHKEK